MDDSRAGRVWASINARARAEGAAPAVRHACIACAGAVAAIGAGLSMTRGPGLREPVFATDARSEELEELQFTIGQGPYVDAAGGDGPVLVADLSSADSRHRWPMFTPAAAERGVAAMFAIPIHAGAARLGVLNLYRHEPGPLSRGQLADALAYSDAIMILVLDHRGGITTSLDNLGGAGFTERRAEVHQAAGMISVQLGVGVTDALTRLRAYAYLHDRRLAEVAAEVVARRLRFRPDGQSGADDDGTGLGDNKGPGSPRPPADNDKEGDR